MNWGLLLNLKKKMEKVSQGLRASIHPFLLPGPFRSQESQPHNPVVMDATMPSWS